MQLERPRPRVRGFRMPPASAYIMAVVLLLLGFYLIGPALMLVILSFNASADILVGPPQWGLQHWRDAWSTPGLVSSLGNSIMIGALVVGISFPIAVLVSWVLARTKIPFSYTIEFMFWVSFMMPDIATTLAWMMLLAPGSGLINILPLVDGSSFNIFSVPGIVWAHLMANGISIKVMLLTPAFRNMDASMEEVGGTTNILTMMRATLPFMVPPMALVFALQLLHTFQSFETEWLLGRPFGFYVHSTKIYELVNQFGYGLATVLASLTLLVIAVIIPVQRWMTQRGRHATITGSFRPVLIDLGLWKLPTLGIIGFLIVLLTIGPAIVLLLGSFMSVVGDFNAMPTYTLEHWQRVLTDDLILTALRTTLILSITAAILGPLLFSLIAYILVRTRWTGRWALDLIVWGSAAVPGILSSLGLLWLILRMPWMPWLTVLYGTIYVLLLVVIIQGTTTGTNIMKGVFLRIGADMGEARVAGAGWIRTYLRTWIPLLMPTLVLLAALNFVFAAGTIGSILLLASRDAVTLSILALEFTAIGELEKAGIVSLSIIVLTAVPATVACALGQRLGLRNEQSANQRQAEES